MVGLRLFLDPPIAIERFRSEGGFSGLDLGCKEKGGFGLRG